MSSSIDSRYCNPSPDEKRSRSSSRRSAVKPRVRTNPKKKTSQSRNLLSLFNRKILANDDHRDDVVETPKRNRRDGGSRTRENDSPESQNTESTSNESFDTDSVSSAGAREDPFDGEHHRELLCLTEKNAFGLTPQMALDAVCARARSFQYAEIGNQFVGSQRGGGSGATPSSGPRSLVDDRRNAAACLGREGKVVAFSNAEKTRIDIYYDTCTVVVYVPNPLLKGTTWKRFKLYCTLDDLDELLSKGVDYDMPLITTNEREASFQSEKDAVLTQMDNVKDGISHLQDNYNILKNQVRIHDKAQREKFQKEAEKEGLCLNVHERIGNEVNSYLSKCKRNLSDMVSEMVACNRCDASVDPTMDIVKTRDEIYWMHQDGGGWMATSTKNFQSSPYSRRMHDSLLSHFDFDNSSTKKKSIVYCVIGSWGQYYVRFSDNTHAFYGPKAYERQMLVDSPEDVKTVSFGRTWETYFIVKPDGKWDCGGKVPRSLDSLLLRKEITGLKSVSLGPRGEWCIETMDGEFYWISDVNMQSMKSWRKDMKAGKTTEENNSPLGKLAKYFGECALIPRGE